MVKCPKCGAEIDSLRLERKTTIFQDVYIEDGHLEYGQFDDESAQIDDYDHYYCPECNSLLFDKDNEERIEAFLKGKKAKK